MTKGLFSFFLIFITLLLGALYYTDIIQSPFISALNKVKSNYNASIEFVEKQLVKHFYQASHIEELEEKLQKYEDDHLVMQQLASEINDLLAQNNSTLKTDPNVQLVRAISYQNFGDQNRIWMDIDDYNSSRIYGLVYKELVAGIVVSQNDKALGLLNRDIKCSYAVYVGESRASGIAQGNNAKNLIIKFIPAWFIINIGDEVVTSGLDEIFFKGLKVGKVISVTKSQGYQSAVVEPYYRANDPNYYHMITKVK
ncbi:MAG: rod shape-determining protein MreC [Sulfurimonas sp. RIFOXYD12_FULL_33_39]|uniref:rod shape-determining protein MreC n=1 Tax=unclassified Sulfurimonas TaxID=2623549 RepID=UPI0008CB8E4E|nr:MULTISPECIES: rod shape-determining protein MreC [unclassified Sulfurimonas]OHE05018.1 MAG: rod shape-determining protein MreC [Sulfurimonas sp. RIFCSPLOWO2_12_FULL_34_6]OHE09168.1 MAG: rod shape-determining protein MreC [Sulfurimonas sp. RIFOXYD12_FULL_33_39]OHE14485.1 MAG: rod shape-determining protein MreC [Sulfurimonas sp. RIFOXYD2_FULL_34_21]DAB28644.1 MAG TPA: rod shape-determining protein MreC [Sulfurimonas sp. UBA10385]